MLAHQREPISLNIGRYTYIYLNCISANRRASLACRKSGRKSGSCCGGEDASPIRDFVTARRKRACYLPSILSNAGSS